LEPLTSFYAPLLQTRSCTMATLSKWLPRASRAKMADIPYHPDGLAGLGGTKGLAATGGTQGEKPDSSSETDSLTAQEIKCRKQARHNAMYLFLINGYSAVIVFLFHLVSIETLLSIGLSVGMTIYVYNTAAEDFDGSIMDWVLLSFAMITPVSAVLTMIFRRRENALLYVGTIRATLLEIYSAHALWDWGYDDPQSNDSGRKQLSVDWLAHSDEVFINICDVCSNLSRWLTLPNATRSRHRNTSCGKREAAETYRMGAALYTELVKCIFRLADLSERMKRAGLPATEASRIRQWERLVLENVEWLKNIKMYRSPQGLRSFTRVFSIFLPPFYAPYYAELARSLNSLGSGVAFAVVTSVALTSLFETISQMEDPFIAMSILDGVHVHHELVADFTPYLVALRSQYFPRAGPISLAQTLSRPPSLSESTQQSTTRFFNE